jgi:outer membrane protein OmpA-like peptidoglycan-associated protein
MKKYLLLLALFSVGLIYAQQETKELRVVVYFEVNQDMPAPDALKNLLTDLKNATVISIAGHADTTATEQYNQELSERRANNIAVFLKKKGINLSNTYIKGYGEGQSLGSGLITDRRVVITYIKKEAAVVEKTSQSSLSAEVAEAKKGDKLKLKNMNFENNSDIMLPSSRPVANELLLIMKQNPALVIEIQGHICCQDADVTHVSEKRAFMVYNFLLQNGISKNRLSYKGFGSSQPIYPLPEQSEEQRVANRRVEIEILEN